MFTLQILDRGQTSFFPLAGDRSLLIGSSAAADLRLGEADVLAEHARLEPAGEGWRLVPLAKVLVNGRAAQAVELTLGDRLEIGQAVLVLGASVSRPVQPEDVLADAVVSRRRAASPRRSGSRLLPALAAIAALVAIGFFALQSDDRSQVQSELATISRWQAEGELDRADAAIGRLQTAWRTAADDRLVRLQGALANGQAIRAAQAKIEAEVRDPADTRHYAAWIRELQRREREGDPTERVAARLARANLNDTLRQRPQHAATEVEVPAPPAIAATADTAAGGPQDAGAAARTEWLDDAAKFVAQGLFAQADAALEMGLAEADNAAGVASLQAAREHVREQAKAAMQDQLSRAEALLAEGRAREAVTLLANAQHRWPASTEYAPLGAALRKAEAAAELAVAQARPQPVPAAATPTPAPSPAPSPTQASSPAESVRVGSLAALRVKLDAVRDAEEAGDHAMAARLLAEAAEQVGDGDPDFAARLRARSQEAGWLANWNSTVAAALPLDQPAKLRLRDGSSGELVGLQGSALRLAGDAVPAAVAWTDVDAASLESLATKLGVRGDGALGLATVLYRSGERARAEQVLAKLLRSDESRKVDVDRVIARGRDEAYDPRGYSLEKQGFVSARDLATQKLAKSMAGEVSGALRAKDPAAWDAFLQRAMARGPDSLDALGVALRGEFATQVQKLESAGIKKQFDKLAARRADLDAARDHARALIYDETKYFYPYKPPAVSSDRFAEYNRVQAEVNERVQALRDCWGDESVRIRVPGTLRADLDRLDWLARGLASLGHGDAVSAVDIGWARALPAGESIGLQEFCLDPAERADLEEWRRIDAYNAVIEKQVASAVREQLRVTNAYRAMFRHRPLALVANVCSAAQGHADEMSTLGYFAHMSPTPGRKTPTDRMRLAGYNFGVTENIALTDSARGAHDAWCRSSGHHRNLLNPRHTELGVGANGRYWVQNFGSGSTYLQAEAWRDTFVGAGKKR